MATKKQEYDLHELYKKLVGLTDDLINATDRLSEIRDNDEMTIAGAGFNAGQAYSIIDKVGDALNDITDDIDRQLNH
jgi:hypothetical protein